MKKTTLALVAAACLLGAVQAQAQTSQFYGVGSVNYTKIEDFKEFGAGARLGYQFNNNFALEGSLDYYGEANTQFNGVNVDLDARSIGLAGVYRVPVSATTFVRGSLGFARYRAEASAGGLSASDSSTEPFVGFGVEYAFNKGMSLLGEYRYTRIEDSNANNFNLGLKFNF